jgi:enoyl-CoA hydratase
MSEEEGIRLGRQGGLATILIDRPRALNALTLADYRQIDPALRGWAAGPSVRAVLVQGAGDRAFCAGGDVRAICEAGRGIAGDPALTSVFFREEYEVIRQVHRYPKPYIAIIAGITMGGGAGMSVNGAYRIATERTLFAMPETSIGLFPDVGATHFLNRCPGRVGRYLALTGARLKAADARYCGFATHFVAQQQVAELVAALDQIDWQPGRERAQVDALLAAFAGDPGPAPLAELRRAIDRCFAPDTVEAILEALAAEASRSGWAAQTRADLLTKSPTSLKVTLRQLAVGHDFDLEAALALEYRLTQHFMAGHDFYEGVRAMLVDKDQRPQWRPATLAEVGEEMVAAHFAPLGAAELRFA